MKQTASAPVRVQNQTNRVSLQRQQAVNEATMTDIAPPIVHDVLRSPGQPLDNQTRIFMESRFGQDFTRVRIHVDAKAAESARTIDARAYTLGKHIAFGSGQYAPASLEGRHLLGHELTHVLQQKNSVGTIPYQLAINNEINLENEADRVAKIAIGHHDIQANIISSQISPVIQRSETQTRDRTGPAARDSSPAASCLMPVLGEEIETLLESRVVTIIEYGAEWCGPCQMLQNDLVAMCRQFHTDPPAARVRFFTVDVDNPRNAETARRYAQGGIPKLSIYVGTTRREHFESRPSSAVLEQVVSEQIEYASTSGAGRGASTGMWWGLGLGALGGIATALALSASAGIGALAGLGIIAGITAAGFGLGAGLGALIGWMADNRDRDRQARVGSFEAETLIRRRFGSYLPGTQRPLHNAQIRPVTQEELRMRYRCRHPDTSRNLTSMVGWTDHGPEPSRSGESAEDEQTCANGAQLERATTERPVIYYARDHQNATILIHEGLHAYAHPNFSAQVRNYVLEGATQYFTRQIEEDIGTSSPSGYGSNVQAIERLTTVIGEEALRQAYFRGYFSAANSVLGPCGLEAWAQSLQMYSDSRAETILRTRNQNYCEQVTVFPVRRDAE